MSNDRIMQEQLMMQNNMFRTQKYQNEGNQAIELTH